MSYDFYEFKKEEYENRLNKLKEVMHEKRLDAVILTEEENIRWISGYWVFTMQDGSMSTVVIIPYSDNKDPVLLLSKEATGEELSWIKKMKYWEEAYSSYLTANKGKVLVDTLDELSLSTFKIGMELGNGMRINLEQKDIDYFREKTAEFEIIDISDKLLELRSIKSNAEIEKLKKASEITTESFKEGFKNLKEGITERKLGQYFAEYFFKHGATGISHIGVGFGAQAIKYAHSDPKEYPLKRGDVVKVDIGCTFEGYRCDMYRMACLGKPSSMEAKVALTIKEANQAVIKNIREGAICSDLYHIALKVFADAGLDYLLSPSHYVGHGIGLGVHELPYIYKNNNAVLKAGMVLTIEPWTFNYKDLSMCMNIEDVVVVTKDGCEVLTDMERDIYLV